MLKAHAPLELALVVICPKELVKGSVNKIGAAIVAVTVGVALMVMVVVAVLLQPCTLVPVTV